MDHTKQSELTAKVWRCQNSLKRRTLYPVAPISGHIHRMSRKTSTLRRRGEPFPGKLCRLRMVSFFPGLYIQRRTYDP